VKNSPHFTIGELQQLLVGKSVRIVTSEGQSHTVDVGEIGTLFSAETPVTPNGHNGSYTIYSEGGYTVLTPVSQSQKLPWSSV
jgi:hypothetical protein